MDPAFQSVRKIEWGTLPKGTCKLILYSKYWSIAQRKVDVVMSQLLICRMIGGMRRESDSKCENEKRD